MRTAGIAVALESCAAILLYMIQIEGKTLDQINLILPVAC